MRYWKFLEALAVAAILIVSLVPKIRADEANQLTILKFSEPVEIPGKVLPAGSYVFKILDVAGDRDVVQVYNKDQTQLYATVVTIPDYIDQPHDRTYIRFAERASNSPVALKAWFYPGDNYGHEFVYSHMNALELARANHQSVASMPDSMASNMNKPIHDANDSSVAALKSTTVSRTTPDDKQQPISHSASNSHP